MENKYKDYSEGGSGGGFDNTELRLTAYTTIEGTLARVFGTSSQYGQSLGVVFRDAKLTDGTLYFDPEKGHYKTFSWKEATGFSVAEAVEEGNEPTAEDAPEVLPKTYADTQKRYELVGAVINEATDEDGEVLVEASAIARPFEYEGGEVEFGEFEDVDGAIEMGETITWFNGTRENGPNTSAIRLAELLTRLGEDAVVSEDDLYDWLADASGSNIIRGELEGRAFRFFIVKRDSEETEHSYNYPVLEDLKTGEAIERDHSGDGDSGN